MSHMSRSNSDLKLLSKNMTSEMSRNRFHRSQGPSKLKCFAAHHFMGRAEGKGVGPIVRFHVFDHRQTVNFIIIDKSKI